MTQNNDKIERQNAIMQKSLAGMNGLTGIIGANSGIMRLGNTSGQESAIYDLNNIGRGLTSFDDISRGYSMIGNQPQIIYDDVRGSDDTEQIGDIFSSTMSGAVSGAEIGGATGALVGGIVGLGSGVYGKITGDAVAQNKYDSLKLDALIATDHARQNLNASSEFLSDMTHRQRVSNLNSTGGKIEKKMLTAKEFADKVLGRQKQSPITNSSGLVIKKCDGGTMIRIKR